MPDQPRSKRIMLVAQRPSDYVEMKRCAIALSRCGYDMIIVYYISGAPRPDELPVLEDMHRLKEAGEIADAFMFELTARSAFPLPSNFDNAEEQDAAASVPKLIRVSSYRKYAPRFLFRHRHTLIRFPLAIARQIWLPVTFVRTLKAIDATIAHLNLDAIVLPEDVVGLVTPLVVRAGHQHNLPSVIIPYTIANQSEAFQSLRGNGSYQLSRFANAIVGTLFPRWVMRRDGVALVRLPAPHIVGQELTRTAPPDPWMMNSGYADVIAVENEAMRDYYSAAGIPADKMRVVGAVYDDTLASYINAKEAEIAKLRAALGIETARPILVIGGCPDQSTSCPRFDFTDMRAFCDRLAAGVREVAADYEVVVRPHPNYPEMGSMLANHGFLVSMIDTARLVALSDAYIAFGSATIRWAISCGVPTINYDVFGYDYDDFKTVAGVANVSSIDAFEAALIELRRHGDEYLNWKQRSETDAQRWGTLDGCSVERIVALIEEFCAARSGPRGTVGARAGQEQS